MSYKFIVRNPRDSGDNGWAGRLAALADEAEAVAEALEARAGALADAAAGD